MAGFMATVMVRTQGPGLNAGPEIFGLQPNHRLCHDLKQFSVLEIQ